MREVPRDLTDANFLPDAVRYLAEAHAPALTWLAAYTVLKLACRLRWRRKAKETHLAYGTRVWDPVCLIHNMLSIGVGAWALWTWQLPLADTCGAAPLSNPAALVILLQGVHSMSDFLIFLPQMLAEPVFIFHHAILIVVSLVLPHCPGCFYTVFAFAIAEFGSASIAVDAEWRKTGGQSRGLKRVVVFGASRVVNLVLLHQIWLVTPTVHIISLTDSTDGSTLLKLNLPLCMITSIGGSAMMLAVNGLTWWRMWKAYLKQKAKRKAAAATRKAA